MTFWCEINKENIINNAKRIKDLSKKKVVAVVKGNAYGLGMQEVVDILKDTVDLYGVSSTKEASQLVTDKDILIMSPLSNTNVEHKENYIYTIDSRLDLETFDTSKIHRVHIYIDTGMNRLGIKEKNFDAIVRAIKNNFPNIRIEGIYTHLHNAGNIEASKKQIDILRRIHEKYPEISNIHCLNSKGIVTNELLEYASFTNIVRAGNLLYGYEGLKIGFSRTFQIKAAVVKRFTLEEDSYIGYGSKYFIKKGTSVGILECGTIDKIGYYKNIKRNMFIDCLRVIKSYFSKTCVGYYKNKPVYQVCSPNMNCTLVDISSFKEDTDIVINLSMSSLLIDSNIPKAYV